MEWKVRLLNRLAPFVGLAFIALALVLFNSDVLYRIQEQHLFLHTPLFFSQCMVTSGGLLSWMGAFLTQFFYYPVLGVVLLCLCWAVLMGLLQLVFRVPAHWMMVTLVPVVLLLIANVDLGYWIFYLKLRGYFFVGTLGTMAAVALVGCYRWLVPVRPWLGLLVVAVSVIAGYPLFGFYALLAVVLMSVVAWRDVKRRMALLTTLTAIGLVLLVPVVYYHTLYHETNIVNIYWTALPVFQHYQVSSPAYLVPYLLLVIVLLLMAAVKWPAHRSLSPFHLLTFALFIAFFWYKDGNYYRELQMSRAIGQQDWERVVAISAEADNPTRFELLVGVDEAVTRFAVKGQQAQEVICEGIKVCPSIDEWRTLTAAAKGRSIDVEIYVRKAENWLRLQPFQIHVSKDSIDPWLSYRMI